MSSDAKWLATISFPLRFEDQERSKKSVTWGKKLLFRNCFVIYIPIKVLCIS